MTEQPSGPPAGERDGARAVVTPPPLPAILLDPVPVIIVCTLAWVVAAVVAFTAGSLQSWRPVTVAGLGLAVFGTLLFLWQRRAARSGSRGAQTGLA
ncbi:DUF2530 domain-containing protein [Mycobacterium sp.]|uniref:DUF2530 domain-containing protein n=1 Tax=Mycobacterium sp. TaxID=1785 RepID=UPI002BCBA0C7|nr:DUF2530 domain-containing protein [Mycobacterium sp.]HME49773.1 DUF2530 domain-containing protein [Mycobacterium sp.]